MSPMITYPLMTVLIAYAVVIIIELVSVRNFKRLVPEGMVLVGVFLLLNRAAGFPAIRQPFGGVTPPFSVIIVFACVLLGIVAHYLFHLERQFHWGECLRPLVISPIVVLSLFGWIERSSDFETTQLIFLALLAFQNGFFWKEVLRRAK